MARAKAEVEVVMNTKRAKSELRSLVTEGAKTSARVGGSIRGVVGKGLGAVGLGGGIGAGFAAAKAATSSSFGDVVGEAFGGIGAVIERSILGDLGEKARADASARGETIRAFGAVAGATGAIPPGAKDFFNQVRTLRAEEEKGRGLFERDDRFRSVGAKEIMDTVLEKLKAMFMEIAQWLANEVLKKMGLGK